MFFKGPEEIGISKEMIDWLKKAPKLLLVGFFLLAIGFLGGIICKIEFFQPFFSIGLSLILLWGGKEIYRRLPRLLKREQVIDSWYALIKNGQGEAETIFQETKDLIDKSKAQDEVENYRAQRLNKVSSAYYQ